MNYPADTAALVAPHFRRREIACPCCGLCNADPLALLTLEWVRELVGCGFSPNSFCRCAQHNKKVGGKPRSQHLLGRAFDVPRLAGMTPQQMAQLAESIPYVRGIGVYDWGVHFDVREGPEWRG